MGRPLNKRYFGDFSNSGQQLVVEADLGSGIVNAWVVKQKGTRTYVLTDGTDTMTCRLVETITGPGEATIEVYPFSGPTQYVYTLLAHRVKTQDGQNLVWKFEPPVDDTTVEVHNS